MKTKFSLLLLLPLLLAAAPNAEALPKGKMQGGCERWNTCPKPRRIIKRGSWFYFKNTSSYSIWFKANQRWYKVSPYKTRSVWVKAYHSHVNVEFDNSFRNGYQRHRQAPQIFHLGYNSLKNKATFRVDHGKIRLYEQRGH